MGEVTLITVSITNDSSSSCCICVVSSRAGLFGLAHGQKDSDVDIVQVKPGHVEIYNLDTLGKASFQEEIQFHSAGERPKHALPRELSKWTFRNYPKCIIFSHVLHFANLAK